MESNKLKPAMSMYASKADFEAAMESWLEDDLSEESFDSEGNSTPGGLYDAGGHLIVERWADYADHVFDEFKYRDL